ncbi:hypothetical protein GJ496_005530 [Pomphorhynchus laevis]|nr:hypothetical protein GJ496_005530 [Pomphorhynchus laevis]
MDEFKRFLFTSGERRLRSVRGKEVPSLPKNDICHCLGFSKVPQVQGCTVLRYQSGSQRIAFHLPFTFGAALTLPSQRYVNRLRRLPCSHFPTFDSSFSDLLLAPKEPASDAEILSQSRLPSIVDNTTYENLLVRLNHFDRARCLAVAQPHASAWLHVIPNKGSLTVFPSPQFCALIRMWFDSNANAEGFKYRKYKQRVESDSYNFRPAVVEGFGGWNDSRHPLPDSSYKDIPGSVGGLNAQAILASLENSEVAIATTAIETIKEVVAENKRCFDFTESINTTGTKMRETDNEEEYCESFKVFNRYDNGFTSASEIRQFMTNLGGKLTDDKELQNFKETKYSVFAREKYTDSQMPKLLPAQRLRRHRHLLCHIERQLNTKQQELQASIERCSKTNLSFCSNCVDQQSVLVNGTDCSDNRNQTNFTEVDNGLNDVRTSDEKVTDLPGEEEEEPTTIYVGSALTDHYFSSEEFGERIILMSAGVEMMTIKADNDDESTKVENASGKKKRNVKLGVDGISDDDISLHIIEDEDDDVNMDFDEDENEDDSDEKEFDNNEL